MTVLAFVRRFLADYARNRVNLLLLVVVPVVFVAVVAGTLADAARILGGRGGAAVENATAAWSAAFLAGIGMYFQSAATRDTDQRVVLAGLRARMAAASHRLALAVLVSAIALVTLALRTGIDRPGHVVVGTLMAAVIYVAIGTAVGTLVSNPVNGSVVVLLIWILDVFLGPAMGAQERVGTRILPTHFVTSWMVDLPSGHAGRLGDVGWALVWTVAAVAVAWTLAVRRTRRAGQPRRRQRPGGWRAQLAGAGRAAWRDARRNPALWALYVAVPVIFILLADAITPDQPITVTVREHGRRLAGSYPMPEVHGATMAPIAVASLAALAGLFTLLDSRAGDRRAALAGLRPAALLAGRLGVLAAAALLATVVSLATTASVFDAVRWPVYAAGNLLVAGTYALVGALLAPVFGRVGGVFMAFLLPFLDLGISQSPMLRSQPPSWAKALPGYGSVRVLLDGALTRGFDELGALVLASGWIVVLSLAVAVAYRRSVSPPGSLVTALARPAASRPGQSGTFNGVRG
ncbi:ABC transporter permease [Micromonospora aurantiaca (nom. illeg.)]|uniref:ABC transporter permease n=1 Tax=Micromonospora aurantiaca (nom. illeg.) TaxID=47850 RepID=UPI003DA463F7